MSVSKSLSEIIQEIQEGNNSQPDPDGVELGEQIKLKLERYQQNTEYRSLLAIWTMIVVTVWLIIVIGILLFDTDCCGKQKLSDSVLIALLGTTTLNVLGLSYIVLKGYFASSEKES